MRIAFMGDVVPGGILYENLQRDGFRLFPHKFQMLLNQFEMRVCNLECPLYDGTELKREKAVLRSPTMSIKALKTAGIDLVSLANNHIFDYGIEGFQSTLSMLRKYEIGFVGAGMSLNEARTPYIVSNQGIKIGFLGYSDLLDESTPATHDSPGIAPISWNIITEDIARLKAECDYSVLLLHWGNEYTSFPPLENVYKAGNLLQLGVAVIIGTHSHCIQGRISQDGNHAFFGIGNLLFPDYYYSVHQPCTSVMVYPNANEQIPEIPPKRWSAGSRISILLDVKLDRERCLLRYIPTYQTKSHKIIILDGWRKFLVRRWVDILSISYNTSNYPNIYNILAKIESFIWSVIFRGLLTRGLIRPILMKLRLYEKSKRWYKKVIRFM